MIFPGALRLHVGRYRRAAVDRREEIPVERLAHRLGLDHRGVGDPRVAAATCVAYENVDAPPARVHGGGVFLKGLRIAGVEFGEMHIAVVFAQRLVQAAVHQTRGLQRVLLGGLQVQVAHGDVGAQRGQALRVGQADAAGAARDDRHFSRQFSH